MTVNRQNAAVPCPWFVDVGEKWLSSHEGTPCFHHHLHEPEGGALLFVRKTVEFSKWITLKVLTELGGLVLEDLAVETNEPELTG